ncbi:MAG TPA: hypothetical protein ENN23_00280 [Deltaproteobacteria bacterium]|nr:hypothetical protein [Deltaproteobacteria bacterium]
MKVKKVIFIRTLICILCFAALSPQGLTAQDQSFLGQDTIVRDEPIEITSERMDALSEDRMVIFSGNARVKQGDRLLKADQLDLFYKKEPDKKVRAPKSPFAATGEMERIRAKGNVSTTQGERIVTSDEAVYYHDTRQIVLIGNAVLREGDSVIKGCRVTIYLDENRGKVEQCEEQQRVRAIIHPQALRSLEKQK